MIAGEAGALRHIGECAVAVVAIKNDAAEAGDQQIGPAVVVVVADDGAHGPAGIAHAGLVGNIGKCAVMVVVVERAARLLAVQAPCPRSAHW